MVRRLIVLAMKSLGELNISGEENLTRLKEKPQAYQQAITQYLPYYNNERLHMGINYLTPI